MVKVKNKETLRFLSKQFLKINKGRNIIVIIAIMLTSLLFTSVFSASFSILKSTRAQQIRGSSNSAHANIDKLTRDKYNKALNVIKDDKDIEKCGVSIFLGMAANDELTSSQTDVNYANDVFANSSLASPTKGKLPKDENEIACSTITLDSLGIPHKLGSKVKISINSNDKVYTNTFTLSGFWKGDHISKAQHIWVSKDYADKIRYNITADDIDNGMFDGSYEISLYYKNTYKLEEKVNKLNKTLGYDDNAQGSFSYNPAYIIFQEDGFSFEALGIIIAIILLSGYLIIYNVFNISINTDIHAYALLKNIGTTGKQLKSIVRRQSIYLSIIGIPIGLLIGYILGAAFTPALMADMNDMYDMSLRKTSISSSPLIFIVSAVFSFITVYIGCLKPCHIIAKLSPVEAIKMTDSNNSKKKFTKSMNVSPAQMAFSNIKRTWKKGIVIMLSIAMSLMTLNAAFIISKGFNLRKFAKAYMQYDFSISQITDNLYTSNLNGINTSVKKQVKDCPNSENKGFVYYSSCNHNMDDELYNNYSQLYNESKKDMPKWLRKQCEETLTNKQIKVHIIGLDEGAFKKLEFKNKKCSWKEFSKGKYVIAGYPEYPQDSKYYKKGDKVTLEYTNDMSKDYKVLEEANIVYSLDYPFGDNQFITLYVPEEEYIKCTGNNKAMRVFIDAKAGKRESVEKYINNKVLKDNSNLLVSSILNLKKEFSNFINKYYLICGVLTVVLAVIGIMNFFNSMETSIIARKKELSLLEVVGMSKKQIKKMLVIEGSIYIVGAFIIAITAGLYIDKILIMRTVGLAFFFKLKLSVLPCILVLPILAFIAYFVPTYNYKKMSKVSIVERIRNE